MKPIRLSQHALSYVVRRGFAPADVEKAIREGMWGNAENGRRDARMDFEFNSVWNGKSYQTKQVRPVFVEEEAEIVVVTVYTYFF